MAYSNPPSLYQVQYFESPRARDCGLGAAVMVRTRLHGVGSPQRAHAEGRRRGAPTCDVAVALAAAILVAGRHGLAVFAALLRHCGPRHRRTAAAVVAPTRVVVAPTRPVVAPIHAAFPLLRPPFPASVEIDRYSYVPVAASSWFLFFDCSFFLSCRIVSLTRGG